MEKDSLRNNNNNGNGNSTNYSRDRTAGAGVNGGMLRSSSDPTKQTLSSSDFVLQWGNRKRLRCMKFQVKGDHSGPVNRTTVRVDRRVVRAEKDSSNQPSNNNHGNGYFNLRQRPASPQAPPPQRFLRNSENSGAMRGQSNGAVRGFSSPDRGAHDKRVGGNNHNNNNNHHHHHRSSSHNNNKSAASSDMAHDSKKGGSSSGSGEAAAATAPIVWPPKFVIALTNKEKEEDFMAIKGSKLPQRPKKRAKFIQRTLNLVSPGAWLCDLTLDRYEVREKKISKKSPRGLKAMGNTNMESDSE
ncbi:vacuolar-processing enzyme-like [Hibiscus syriacus]|uniref:Vacuolar-processing enzyme-like n=1 Tax=Hibiscus syriacus TaxID=106335 RepID=A0A6A2Y790_HIBSY|nr:homeobox protein 2-like [Hibiscus syriacus]KAE8669079.1 vacuolar-processing enzyme-like [Hibiscus syriacus]